MNDNSTENLLNNTENMDDSENSENSENLNDTYNVPTLKNRFVNTIRSIGKSIYNLHLCGCMNIEDMGEYLDDLGDVIDDYNRTPGDDLREIAEAMKNEELEMKEISPITEPTTIKIRLGFDTEIVQIMFRDSDNNYITIPFGKGKIYFINQYTNLQNIVDKWFIENDYNLLANKSLFDQLESYYKNSKNKRSSIWFQKRTEWIKFNLKNGDMIPCGFKRFRQNISETTSEYSEYSEDN